MKYKTQVSWNSHQWTDIASFELCSDAVDCAYNNAMRNRLRYLYRVVRVYSENHPIWEVECYRTFLKEEKGAIEDESLNWIELGF